MSVTFYPHDEDVAVGALKDKLEIMMEAAERYKAIVLDTAGGGTMGAPEAGKRLTPKEIKVAYNWQEAAKLMREIREMPENNVSSKATKADRLTRLAEVYEVLRGAKMPKLESVRATLMAEASQLRVGTTGVVNK